MHYSPLCERRGFILDQLSSAGISQFELVTEFDREDLTHEDLSRYNDDPDFHRQVCEISRQPHGFAGLTPYTYQKMTLASISLNLKHLESFNRFTNQEVEFALFLEDDCNFCGHPFDINTIINNVFNLLIVSVLNLSGNCTANSIINEPLTLSLSIPISGIIFLYPG